MKRTALFGLICVLAAAPFVLGAVLMLMDVSSSSYANLAMARPDAALYAFLAGMSSSGWFRGAAVAILAFWFGFVAWTAWRRVLYQVTA